MDYQETLHYLYTVTPLFQQKGAGAYKPGLRVTQMLDKHLGHPHRNFKTIHIAGTNGKGSCAHTLAALFQLLGLKTGLYTSPHLVDFRERIRVNGQPIPKHYVVNFIERERPFFEPLSPSFFELTTALAFRYFSDVGVDVAVIEVGLGGRLDCTNIITPLLSVITNISLDHTQFLGDTLAEIAREKAGIIKPNIPVVIGESLPETRPVFEAAARAAGSPIMFAQDTPEILSSTVDSLNLRHYVTKHYGELVGALVGDYQVQNANTILHVITALYERKLLMMEGMTHDVVSRAFANVDRLTGLRGRWEVVQRSPEVVCDTGHNPGGWQYLGRTLRRHVAEGQRLHIVFGVMADKDFSHILSELPKGAMYYFTQANLPRALSVDKLVDAAACHELTGQAFTSIADAVVAAIEEASPADMIFIGGSSFVVAEALAYFDRLHQST